MSALFLKIVNMSISASWIVLAMLLLRFLLKKAPKWIIVMLWGIVAIRLICPISIESVMSLIPSAETISPQLLIEEPEIHSGFPMLNHTLNPIIQGSSIAIAPEKSINTLQLLVLIFSKAWIIGLAAMLLYTALSYFKIKRKVKTAVLLRDNIFQSENVVSPFVLGMIKPKIYLPFNMGEQEMAQVIAHENAHIRRKDHWWKPLGFLLLAIHWFNPLIWLGYFLLCRDIELACDEKVIKDLSPDQKADYSQALLSCSVNRRMIAACPLAFGEGSVKSRVKSVLHYKKPSFWIIAAALLASVAVAVCFLTNPRSDKNLGISSLKNGSDLSGVSLQIVNSELSAPDPFIHIKWINDTSKKISFGEQFEVYYNQGEKWENCSIVEDPVWHLIAYPLESKSAIEHTYKLNGQIMTQPGKYRFEAPFSIDENNESNYKVWIEFELNEGVEGIAVHTFKPIELVYDDGMYSFVQTADTAPTYRIVNGMQLFEITDGHISTPIGTFEEIPLNKESFDSRFRGNANNSWLTNDTLKSLKKNNKRLWQLFSAKPSDPPRLYLLLEQKDGTFLLGHGYYNCNSNHPQNADDSHIRWLYKLEESSISSVGGAEAPALAVAKIIDRSVTEGITTDEAIEPFCMDENYIYSFPSIRSEYVIVEFNDGSEMNVITALEKGFITIADLDRWGIKYDKEKYDGALTLDENGNIIRISSIPKDLYHSTLGHFQALYEQTPTEEIQEKYDNEELVITKMHYYNTDKQWCSGGYTYKYRLEITGRMNNAAKNTTYIILSNSKDITFDQAWKASGFSSLMSDYFDPKDAMIVGQKLFS